MSSILVLATLGFAPALAQEADPGDEPDPGAEAAAPAGAPLEVEASTLYVSPTTDAIPPTLRNQFPPSAVCVVQPDLCPESADPLRKGVVDGMKAVNDNEQPSPVQPVPPDTAAVSFLGGQTRYQTAIRFVVPDVPAGQEIVSFTITVPQSQPSYEAGSPAFRRAVLAVFETIGPQDPAILADGLAAALEEDPVEVDPGLIGIEACPLLSEFTPGGAPQASPDTALPQREEGEQKVVDVDCIFGTNAVRAEGENWVFDLTFTAAAWASGELENHGLLLRPIGAPNLAFGDPDTSTTAQVALDLAAVTAAMETAEPAPPVDGLPAEGAPPAEVADAGLGGGGFDDGGFDDSGGFDDGGFEETGGGLADVGDFEETPLTDDGGVAPGAEVADPAADEAPQAAVVPAAEEGPAQPWWVWLLVPIFVGGAYATSQALTGAAGAGTGAAGGGALSRLMARRGNGAPV
ncbi:MAG: hypothetical protein WD378_02835 [Egicoccus sp.]